jgi:hypothetical protein
MEGPGIYRDFFMDSYSGFIYRENPLWYFFPVYWQPARFPIGYHGKSRPKGV